MNPSDTLMRGGAKGVGLAELAAIGLQIPPTWVVDPRTAAVPPIPAFLSSGDIIVRPSPVVPSEVLPKMSGLFDSVITQASGLLAVLNDLRNSGESPQADKQLAVFSLPAPEMRLLLQPHLPAAVSGIAHLEEGGDVRLVWTPGPLAPLADGRSSGMEMWSVNPPAFRFHARDERLVMRHRAALAAGLTNIAKAGALHRAVEIEWLVTPEREFFAVQCQSVTW